MLNFKRSRFPNDGILVCIRWYVAYTAKRAMAAPKHFFDKAMRANGDPGRIGMDMSGANKAAIDAINAGYDVPILVRQIKYLNNIAEQDHRAIKRVTRPLLIFKLLRSAGSVLAGIDLMHMIRKGQFAVDNAARMSFGAQAEESPCPGCHNHPRHMPGAGCLAAHPHCNQFAS